MRQCCMLASWRVACGMVVMLVGVEVGVALRRHCSHSQQSQVEWPPKHWLHRLEAAVCILPPAPIPTFIRAPAINVLGKLHGKQ